MKRNTEKDARGEYTRIRVLEAGKEEIFGNTHII